MEFFVLGHAFDPGLFGKFGGRFENPVFDEMGFYVLGHGEWGLEGFGRRSVSCLEFHLFIRNMGNEKVFLIITPRAF